MSDSDARREDNSEDRYRKAEQERADKIAAALEARRCKLYDWHDFPCTLDAGHERGEGPHYNAKACVHALKNNRRLILPDLKQCQAEKSNGVNFMTFGGRAEMIRCKAKPAIIVIEKKEDAPGVGRGSMSLCNDCHDAFEIKMPEGVYSWFGIPQINPGWRMCQDCFDSTPETRKLCEICVHNKELIESYKTVNDNLTKRISDMRASRGPTGV